MARVSLFLLVVLLGFVLFTEQISVAAEETGEEPPPKENVEGPPEVAAECKRTWRRCDSDKECCSKKCTDIVNGIKRCARSENNGCKTQWRSCKEDKECCSEKCLGYGRCARDNPGH